MLMNKISLKRSKQAEEEEGERKEIQEPQSILQAYIYKILLINVL